MSAQTVVLILLALLVIALAAALAVMFFRMQRSRREVEHGGMTLMQQQLDALRAQLSESLHKTNEVMNQQLGHVSAQVQSQMNTVLQGLQATTGQINVRLDDASRVVQNVSHQLGSLSQATEKIFEATKNISALEDILKPPKLRGGMGEILLENVLQEILPSRDFFSCQYCFKTGDTVDAVIRLKDGLIPIDAKFPLDNFRRMIETGDEKEKATWRKEFTKNVRKHIDDIASKYILPDETIFNFALMYIPAENVYYETIIRDDTDNGADLYSYASKRHVFPVSPNSLYPYLMTLALGLRGLKIEQEARAILGELTRLYGDLDRFSKDYRVVGDHLSNALKKYGEAEKKLDRIDAKLLTLKEGSPTDHPELGLWNGQK